MNSFDFSVDKKFQQRREDVKQMQERSDGDPNYVFEAIVEVTGLPAFAVTKDFNGQDVPLEILQNVKTVKVHFYCGKLTVFFTTDTGKNHLVTHEGSGVIQPGKDRTLFRTGQPGILYTWKSSRFVIDEKQGWSVFGNVIITDDCKKIECDNCG